MKIHSLIYYGFIQVVGFEYKNISNINYQFNSGIMDANYNTDLSKYESEHPFDKKTKIK